MEPTTRTKPRILFTGATTSQDFSALKVQGDICAKPGTEGLQLAEVHWVDCASTQPEQYAPLLRPTLDTGKILVLRHPDARACQALAEIIGCQVEEGAAALMVSRDLKATTPSSYSITVLDTAPRLSVTEHLLEGGDKQPPAARPITSNLTPTRSTRAIGEEDGTQRDWASMFGVHQAGPQPTTGGPGLIPPQGVLYGIRNLTGSYGATLTKENWNATKGKTQPIEFGFNSSFYVYRENGKASADYVVIRVQQATFSPRTLMIRADNAKGYWQFDFQAQCTNNRNAPLLSTSPDTTNSSPLVTQLSVPLHVKYLKDGGCQPNYWSAIQGPTTRTQEGWGLSNRSGVTSGTATWYHFIRDPWNVINDPPDEFGRWWASMYEGGYGGRVKNLNSLSGSSFTVENVSAWRFSASMISANRNVTFTETLRYRLAAFANPSGTGNGHHQISWYSLETHPNSITLDVVAVTNNPSSPCQ
ncbi:hypothetical protein MYSTI_05552 [Myxococcus stipitatus DSM 14675]|uniref:Uncharacterized protein n=1 Tax=Myxococcus stipitatus (strain DSM 14675 / JCM 12634 / Mx s8) TaxID=1278073 RepID=L7UK46_MYXSD|nr:hypothetical protein [Myxococcus stipitatus]AGC46829.1 hypothetical protein MYSTI_05552 [Myxococcus stipitatus DSM 14675]